METMRGYATTRNPSFRRVAKGLERLLIGRAVVRVHCPLYAVPLDDHRALINPLFIDLRGVAPGKKATAGSLGMPPCGCPTAVKQTRCVRPGCASL